VLQRDGEGNAAGEVEQQDKIRHGVRVSLNFGHGRIGA
jgi:hypothetical protein